MRYSRRYIAFTVILLLLVTLKAARWSDDFAQVEPAHANSVQETAFYPLRAAYINSQSAIQASVDGNPVNNTPRHLLVNEDMQVMADSAFIRDTFRVSLRTYEDGRFVLQRGTRKGTFFLNSNEGSYDGNTLSLSHVPMKEQEDYYLPLADLCTLFKYRYTWNADTKTVTISSPEEDDLKLPASYDLREQDRTGRVLEQGKASTCWADAAIGALESSMLPEDNTIFSDTDMVQHNSFGLKEDEGGDYTMAAAYLLDWQGPVKPGGTSAVKHVQEIRFPEKDQDSVKWSVMLYGGVTTSIYADVEDGNLEHSAYYSAADSAYCYTGEERPNHDVVIVGWDDNYEVSHFRGNAQHNGAYICQNSWGRGFGDDGFFYVSYDDANIGSQCAAYTEVEPADNYDHIYQSDLCGWVGQVGYSRPMIVAANTYTAESQEEVQATGFYALGKDTAYQIFFTPEFSGTESLANRQLVAQGKLSERGFYTITFPPQKVSKGQKFAVVVVLDTPGASSPMAIEYQANDRTRNVDITDGEGYISINGLEWERVEDKVSGNLCLKAYSVNTGE